MTAGNLTYAITKYKVPRKVYSRVVASLLIVSLCAVSPGLALANLLRSRSVPLLLANTAFFGMGIGFGISLLNA